MAIEAIFVLLVFVLALGRINVHLAALCASGSAKRQDYQCHHHRRLTAAGQPFEQTKGALWFHLPVPPIAPALRSGSSDRAWLGSALIMRFPGVRGDYADCGADDQ